MNIRDAVEVVELAAIIGGVVQLIRLSVWIGEVKTKMNVMWDVFINDLEMKHLEGRIPQQSKRRWGVLRSK